MSLNVLLVEPDAALADEIRRAFGPAGLEVTSLRAGEPAVERCRQAPPDLILLAAELPDMSGFSVCNRLKRTAQTVPLLLYTADATDAAVEAHRATRTRADDYLRKPFDMAELLGRAAALLHGDAAAPRPPASSSPPAAPRPDGRRPAAEADAPPQLARVDSSQVASRGLAALAAASTPPAAPPPLAVRPTAVPTPPAPPPIGARPQAAIGRVKVGGGRADPADVFAEWPRDPAPPKGTPEEKLEYFRERLRARDAFVARVREAFGELKAQAAELGGERDGLEHELEVARARAAELEQALADAQAAAAAQEARAVDALGKLEESDATRQSISDVLSQAMQDHEAAAQDWSARIGEADAERARLEAELAERTEANARAIAGLEAERADERARLEAARAEAEEAHARALAELDAARAAERDEAGARLAEAEAGLATLAGERDALAADVRRVMAELAAKLEQAAEARRESDAEAAALRAQLDEAHGRAQAVAAELAEATGQIGALEADSAAQTDARAGLEESLRQAQAEARAYDEKAIAAEHAFEAKAAELAAAEQRIHDLGAALDEGRASVAGTKGELARIEAARADAERRAAQAASERDQLAKAVEAARRQGDADRERTKRLEVEIGRLAKLEPVAEEAARLRKEVATLKEMVQQRSAAAESASRAAQAAAAERARAEERLAVEAGRLQGATSRLESELGAARRKLEDLERERTQRGDEARRTQEKGEERRRALAADASEAEKRHQAEVGRLRAAMVELEKHLETRARAELTLKKRVQELEKAQARPPPPPPPRADAAEVAALKARVAKLGEELEELRGENDFLNGEVARGQQRNTQLQAQIASLKES